MRRLWQWALRLGVLGLLAVAVYWMTACDFGWSGPGRTCKAEGALCSTGGECCSGMCSCVDMSEWCTKCVAR